MLAVEQVFTQLAFDEPLLMLKAPGDDTRWFVVEKGGVVRVFPDDPAATLADVEVFADLRGIVDASFNESGLLGMAFHPDFESNEQVFLSYTAPGTPLVSVVSRFTLDLDGSLDLSSEELVLTVPQPFANHNGGNIAFGPDGFLYIALGDGGGAGDPGEHGQDTTTLLGSILRIDVDGAAPYGIPPDNPFAGNTECVDGEGQLDCPEIFAWGFRNPWRFSFDADTGDLWVGDVGQETWEEIDRVEASGNYGWDEREGAHCFEPPAGCSLDNLDPITEYDHALGISVTGGYVYRGSAIPDLVGFYVFGDFGSGRIFAVHSNSEPVTVPEELVDTPVAISSFAEDEAGELYVLDFRNGTIHRVVSP
jgi:glucose/arabinose dehydrogenase